MIATILQVDTSNDLHENKFVAIIIVVIIFGFAIWKAWPALMENNVFSKQKKYDYGRGEELLDSKKSNTNHLLTGMFLLGLFGLGLLIWHYLQPGDYIENNDKRFELYGFFFLSLLGAIGLLIYTVLEEALFTIHNLKYALKVWITTMLVSPIALLIMDRKRIINVKWLLSLYQYTTLIGYGISMVSFAIFVYTVHRITVRFQKTITRRLYILLITEAALLINMFIVGLMLQSGIGWLLQVLLYCVVCGLCVWFYAMDKTVYTDYRNEEQMRGIILDNFEGTGWRTAELLEEILNTTGFYFDKLCQMKMPSWTKGRVALVGDAGYCASPAAGLGGSLAIDGAAALADAFEKCNGDYRKAFEEYNQRFRPFIDEVQAQVVDFGMDVLIPKTEEAISKRNKDGFGF